MTYSKLTAGKNAPVEVNGIIEISKDTGRLKFEFNTEIGGMVVDRIRKHDALPYPINYGFIPQTVSEDGDPVDILVYGVDAIPSGTLISARPIGVLLMTDEKGPDYKILAVPAHKVTDEYDHIQSLDDIPATDKAKLEYFFQHYKDQDAASGRWSTTNGWQDAKAAQDYIEKGIARAKTDYTPPPPVDIKPTA